MRIVLLALVVLGLGAACGADPGADGPATDSSAADTGDAVTIRCAAFYRQSVTTGDFDEDTFSFGADNGRARLRFPELELAADHVNDPYQGRGLVLYVTEPGSDERLAQQTYAFRYREAAANAFGGLPDGHGFTGIHYHYSDGGAELQYYCGRD